MRELILSQPICSAGDAGVIPKKASGNDGFKGPHNDGRRTKTSKAETRRIGRLCRRPSRLSPEEEKTEKGIRYRRRRHLLM